MTTISLAFKMAVIGNCESMMACVKPLLLLLSSSNEGGDYNVCDGVVVARWKNAFKQFWKFVEVCFYSCLFAR